MSKQVITKTCRNCKQIKPLSGFYKHPGSKDGFINHCKVCCLKQAKKYRQTEKGKITHRKGNFRYKKSEKGKATNKRYKQSAKSKSTYKRYYSRYPKKTKARIAVAHTIRAGKLPRPNTLLCHYCPKPAQEYHHWHGYEPEHWLDVVPVCAKCHIN